MSWALDTTRVKVIIDARESTLSSDEDLSGKYAEAEAEIKDRLARQGVDYAYIKTDDPGLDRAAAYLVIAMAFEDVVDNSVRGEMYERKAERYREMFSSEFSGAQYDYDADEDGTITASEEDIALGPAKVLI